MKTLKQAEKYGRKIQKFINLSHWEIKFVEGEYKEDIIATCNSLFNYKKANIIIRPSFYDEKEDSQKMSIIHELLHCHFGFWKNQIEKLAESYDQSSNRINDNINAIDFLEEESVELLARGIYNIIK